MTADGLSFANKLQEIARVPPARPARPAQSMRAAPHPGEDRDTYGLPALSSPQRRPRKPEGPAWPYDEWPFPFASFWTSLLTMALCYPARSLLLTLGALLVGLWLGMKLDGWLRRHPHAGGPRMRWVLGVV